MFRCRGDSLDRLVMRKPSRETDLGRKSFVLCDRRGSGLHISEIRRRAENPLAAKKQCVRYSHPIVSQNQTKSDGAKRPVCISNRKKSKCHLSRCVTNSYVDMRMRQPDSSDSNRSAIRQFRIGFHRIDSLESLLSAGDPGLIENASPGSSGRWTASSSSPSAPCARRSASSRA